jgi:hypothetical protein
MKKPRNIRNNQCKVCQLPAGDQAVLERLHVGGASFESLAARYGMSRWAVARHCRHQLTERRKAELMAGPVKVGELVNAAALESKSLLEYLQVTRGVLFNQFLAAAEASDRNGVATVGARLLDSLRELGRLTSELRVLSGIQITNNVLNVSTTPEWPELEAGLLDIIRRHPPAKEDVLALLAKLEATSTTSGPDGAAYPTIEGVAVREDEIEMAANVN